MQQVEIKQYNPQLKKFLGCCRKVLDESQQDFCKLLEQEFIIDSAHDPKGIAKNLNNIMIDSSQQRQRVAFVFGAGVSRADPFCIPTWADLLKRASTNYFYTTYEVKGISYKDFHKEIVRKQHCMEHKHNKDDFFNNYDVYELAQYIYNNLRDKANNKEDIEAIRIRADAQMFEIVQSCSYENINAIAKDKRITFDKSLLNEIVKVVSKSRVNRIITYNYDNCFELVYNSFKKAKHLYTVFADDQLPDAQTYEAQGDSVIYHVHGYAPFMQESVLKETVTKNSLSSNILSRYGISNDDWKDFLSLPKVKSLVLSEDSYDEIAHSGYKWRNTIQANTFTNYNCVFLGFSATDKNFKRLVKLMNWHYDENDFHRQPVSHYIFMDTDRLIEDIFGIKVNCDEKDFIDIYGNREEWVIAKLQFLYFALRTRRKYLKAYHIYPIWTTISDLKLAINNICECV